MQFSEYPFSHRQSGTGHCIQIFLYLLRMVSDLTSTSRVISVLLAEMSPDTIVKL